VTLPQGKLDGYPRNGLAGVLPDDEIARVGSGSPCGEYLKRILPGWINSRSWVATCLAGRGATGTPRHSPPSENLEN